MLSLKVLKLLLRHWKKMVQIQMEERLESQKFKRKKERQVRKKRNNND